MADINQQAEELARIMEQVGREMDAYGQITKATGDQKRDAEIEAATGMKNFTKGAAAGADAVGHLASAGMAAGKAMLEGKKGAAAFNDSIDGLSKAATAAGIALTLLVPGGAIIKGIIAGFTAVTAATAGMVKASNEMADKIYKGYSGLAKSGAAASDGMTGVFNDAKKLGLSMNELDQFVGLVGENAGDLALFAGSVFEGRQKFAEMGEAMEPYRKQMIAAGMTQEQINEGTMGYIRLQTRMGAAQNMTTTQLAEGAKKYLTEQDALSKLTGQTRKEMEDQNAKALAQQQFASKIRELEMTGQKEAAAELMKLNTMYGAMGPKTQAAFQASVTGNLANADALDINLQSQGEMMRTATAVAAGQMKAADAAQTTGKTIGKFNDEVNVSLGGLNASIGDFQEGEKARQLTAGKGLVENLKAIDEESKKQGLTGAKAADGITDQYAKNIVQQQKLNEKMETVLFKGIDNALVITNKLGNATDTLATGFEVLGKAVNKLLRIVGLGVKEEPTEAEKKAAEVMKGAQGTVDQAKAEKDKAFEGATFKQKFLGIGLTDEQKKAQDAYTEALRQRAEIQESLATEEAVTSKAAPPAAGKQELPAGVAPSTAGGGRGSVAPPVPTAPAAGGGAAPAAAAPAAVAPTTAQPVRLTSQPLEGEGGKDASVKLEDVLKFTARSGSQQAFEGLDNNFKKAVIAAAEQYKAATGNPIQINSAKRDPADQERLYAETVKLGTPGIGPTGMKVAKPGRSLHERGHAVDIQQYKDPAAVAAFNAQGLFQKVPNDPVHFQARDGGVFDGPDTGYNNITLHGTEAVIPLKNGAVPVRLFGDETTKSAETTAPDVVLQNLLTELVGSAGAAPDTGAGQADISASLNNMQSNMFASIQSLQASVMDSKFDVDLRRDIVEPGVDQETQMATNTTEQVVSGDNSAITQMLKDAKEANFAMLDMISELVREQRNANDISTRILQVSSN